MNNNFVHIHERLDIHIRLLSEYIILIEDVFIFYLRIAALLIIKLYFRSLSSSFSRSISELGTSKF